jgi:hypothetical protein
MNVSCRTDSVVRLDVRTGAICVVFNAGIFTVKMH